MAHPTATLLLAVLLAAPPLAAQADNNASDAGMAAKHRDQDDAREALRQGKIMPLTAILEIVAKQAPGIVIEVKLDSHHKRLIYEVDVLTDSGRKRELKLDAGNGEILVADDR